MRLLERRLAKLEAKAKTNADAIFAEALTKLSDAELDEVGLLFQRILVDPDANRSAGDSHIGGLTADELVALLRSAIADCREL